MGYTTEEHWNNYIGNIWKNVFSYTKMNKKCIIEIAPGEMNKVGKGLQLYDFHGEFYVVEPNQIALKKIKSQCKKIGISKIKGISRVLEKSIDKLPKKPSAIVANHILDDLLLGSILSPKEASIFFTNHYFKSPNKTRKIWSRIIQSKTLLDESKIDIVNQFKKIIEKIKPELVLIAQYKSYFFKNNNIHSPDKEALDILNMLRKEYASYEIRSKIPGIKERGRWLILDFRSYH